MQWTKNSALPRWRQIWLTNELFNANNYENGQFCQYFKFHSVLFVSSLIYCWNTVISVSFLCQKCDVCPHLRGCICILLRACAERYSNIYTLNTINIFQIISLHANYMLRVSHCNNALWEMNSIGPLKSLRVRVRVSRMQLDFVANKNPELLSWHVVMIIGSTLRFTTQ